MSGHAAGHRSPCTCGHACWGTEDKLPALQLPVSHYAQLFVMGEVAVELFQESPTAFLQV
jgi:hypothetical protein